jgi:outer membrane protein assembly factor BamB
VLAALLIVTGVAAFLTNRPTVSQTATARQTAIASTQTALPALKGNDWIQYRYDRSGTGNNPEGIITSTNVAQLKQAWTWDAPDIFASTPTVVGRTIYIPNGNTLNAVNLRTGEQLWKYVTDSSGFINSSVTVDPQTQLAYFGTPTHRVFAVNTRDGSLIWKTTLGEPNQPGAYIWSSPLLVNGKVYIGFASEGDHPCVRGALYALDAATGAIAWTHYTAPKGELGGAIWSSPIALPEQHAIVVSTGNPCPGGTVSDLEQDAIVAIDWDTGTTQWVYTAIETDDCDCDFGGGPVSYTYGGQQYFVAGNKFGTVYALRLQGKGVQLAWSRHIATVSNSSISGIIQPPSYADGTVFVAGNNSSSGNSGSCAGAVWALAADTGALRWQACTDHPTIGAGAVSGDVYVNASFGSVVAYRATTGEVLWHADLPGADVYGGVTIAHGALLVGTTKTFLHSFTLDGLAP